MASTNIQDLIKGYCKLYKGGDESNNPYHPEKEFDNIEDWRKEYLKFHIWDAEYVAVRAANSWLSDLEGKMDISKLSKNEKAEEIYKLAVKTKLMKMRTASCDFMKMYFEL